MPLNTHIQSQFEQISRELTTLQNRRVALEKQQTRLNILHQFQQKGVTRADYVGFQPVCRQITN